MLRSGKFRARLADKRHCHLDSHLSTCQNPFVPVSSEFQCDVPIHGNGDYVASPDGRIYYEREGEGPPIVLVAGGPGGSHASFHPWFSRLADAHTVIYFDNIGRGR